ncbi:3-oxoacyl-ACP reductase [candidate division KSB3 bacterium]|uniref:3-oxoacyl-ACP reductase n=1 Tax=candidate division KSB3 bacterium TaxID=2044937 RepID=A0A2G6E0Z7_9BACT|nr:MAG: 3-oxoacyl-ACP reductase [candidate division KSB3 bacterium]PIE28425.1 MAG: 3-oxoacyl-ACP reductase [candidate division KSB3 bacterium]
MKTQTLEDKVAVISGASRGIGKSIALSLAAEGVTVVLVARSEERLNEVREEIEAAGGQALTIAADLLDPDSPQRIVACTMQNYGRLDILINNAGIVLSRSLVETSLEEWDRVMSVNARAPFLLCKAAFPYLKASGEGTIIQVLSVLAEKAYVMQGAYTASKHALMGMTKVLAQEVQADNIRVHTLLPGGVATDMVAGVRPDLKFEDLMQPENISDVVLFLLRHRNNAVIDSVRLRRAVSDPWF